MEKRTFKVGNTVIAQSETQGDEGKITEIRRSTGTRKDLLYRVGKNAYFANELKPAVYALMYQWNYAPAVRSDNKIMLFDSREKAAEEWRKTVEFIHADEFFQDWFFSEEAAATLYEEQDDKTLRFAASHADSNDFVSAYVTMIAIQ